MKQMYLCEAVKYNGRGVGYVQRREYVKMGTLEEAREWFSLTMLPGLQYDRIRVTEIDLE